LSLINEGWAGICDHAPSCPNGLETLAVHILEDDPGVADSLLVLLRNLGHEAVVYPDAETFFEAEPPEADDTIIVDLQLPGISGARVIAWLCRLRRPPRVIAISGQPQSAIDQQVRGLSGLRVLRKPLSSDLISVFA
jgi:FixJ family two-component response regulator